MNWNSTNNKRILGDVPVEAMAPHFAVPAGKFVYFNSSTPTGWCGMRRHRHPAGNDGCIGCHEERRPRCPTGSAPPSAAPSRISLVRTAPRFSYLTEVQPVFDRHCVSCHDYGKPAGGC